MISVIVPCYNEQEVLPQLYDRLSTVCQTWNESFEVILVDDGSKDNTWNIIYDIHSRDHHWKAIRFSRNFGHQTAVSAGIYFAKGDCVIIIDADLQDPPEELYRFINKWREGYEVVYGIRTKRKENVVKRICYKLFYRILRRLADIDIPYDSGDFCLMDRKVVDILNSMPEHNRFVRGLRAWIGFHQIGLEYERKARAAGEPKYTFSKLLKLAFDGILSFSKIPLRFATYFGLIILIMAIIFTLLVIFQHIFNDWFLKIGFKPIPYGIIIAIILFLGGIQFIFLGILGEYLGRIYDEVRNRPMWTIQDMLGIERKFGKNIKVEKG
ncbi:MAG: glycosyltransferase family 2 protein [Candidatus Poribacteria bacterium]